MKLPSILYFSFFLWRKMCLFEEQINVRETERGKGRREFWCAGSLPGCLPGWGCDAVQVCQVDVRSRWVLIEPTLPPRQGGVPISWKLQIGAPAETATHAQGAWTAWPSTCPHTYLWWEHMKCILHNIEINSTYLLATFIPQHNRSQKQTSKYTKTTNRTCCI